MEAAARPAATPDAVPDPNPKSAGAHEDNHEGVDEGAAQAMGLVTTHAYSLLDVQVSTTDMYVIY